MFINKVIRKIKSAVIQYEVGLLQSRAKRHGYSLIAERQPTHSEIVIQNFFKTSHAKNALLSYIVYPFTGDVKNGHSNNNECFAIAEILQDLGYNVDIINWDNTTFLPAKMYDLVIDNHNNLKRLSSYFEHNTTRVFHATNSHWLYQNWVEYGRYYNFFLEKGVAITPPRLMIEGNSIEYCDAVSMFGNDFTKSTYGRYSGKVCHLPVSVTTIPEFLVRDYAEAKKKFLWLNSHGALLKGLDVAVKAFSMLPHLELYVCADSLTDTAFKEAIAQELSKASNITMLGWVDTNSETFKKLTAECAWVIGTSFSEGGGGSILNCMAKGLIPVISKTSSITLEENAGFYLEENNANELAALISRISLLPDADLKEMSLKAYHFVASNHTIENFRKKYKEFLIKVTA